MTFAVGLIGFILGGGIVAAALIGRYANAISDPLDKIYESMRLIQDELDQSRRQTQEIRGLLYALLDEVQQSEVKPIEAKSNKKKRRLMVDREAQRQTMLLDCVDALVQLGHKRKDAKLIVKQTYQRHKPTSLEDMIRKCMINPA